MLMMASKEKTNKEFLKQIMRERERKRETERERERERDFSDYKYSWHYCRLRASWVWGCWNRLLTMVLSDFTHTN